MEAFEEHQQQQAHLAPLVVAAVAGAVGSRACKQQEVVKIALNSRCTDVSRKGFRCKGSWPDNPITFTCDPMSGSVGCMQP